MLGKTARLKEICKLNYYGWNTRICKTEMKLWVVLDSRTEEEKKTAIGMQHLGVFLQLFVGKENLNLKKLNNWGINLYLYNWIVR